MCKILTNEHILIKIIKIRNRCRGVHQNIIDYRTKLKRKKYQIPLAEVFDDDRYDYFRLDNLCNNQEDIIGSLSYYIKSTTPFQRFEFSNIIEYLTMTYMDNNNNDFLITKLRIANTAYFDFHYVFLSVSIKEIAQCKYYKLEYYDSQYNKINEPPKLYINPDRLTRLDENSGYISYTQYLILPTNKLGEVVIPCPISSYYGDSFVLYVYDRFA
ncbi:MAG: hypothetical protein ACK5XF_05320 [Neisseriaceae bacterium]